jgi:hypothetical protein
VLGLDGWLHVYEATSRFSDREKFARGLGDLGFTNIQVEDLGAFTHISAMKSERAPRADARLSGLGQDSGETD